MAKKPTQWTPTESYVLERPDFYRIAIFNRDTGRWVESKPLLPRDALRLHGEVRKCNVNCLLRACRKVDNEEWVANITTSFLSALIELGNN